VVVIDYDDDDDGIPADDPAVTVFVLMPAIPVVG